LRFLIWPIRTQNYSVYPRPTHLPSSPRRHNLLNRPGRKRKKTNKLANQPTSKETVKATPQEVNKPVSPTPRPEHSGDPSLLTSKEKTKYGTYLTDDSIQKIKFRAIETNRDDHQVLQEAVNQYFKKLAK